MIDFTCPGCGKAASLPDDKAGTEHTCAQCGRVFRIPTGAVPGFRGDAAMPKAGAAFPAEPVIQAAGAREAVLPAAFSGLRRPPAEELALCVFFKWFFLIVGCLGTLAQFYLGIKWYGEQTKMGGVTSGEMFWMIAAMAGTFFGGLVLYALFACLARIVGSLYLISKNTEGRK